MKIMNQNKIVYKTIKYLFVTFLFLINVTQVAFGSNLYTLEPFLDLPVQKPLNSAWLPPVANTTRDNELLFTNSTGKVYRSQGQKIQPQPIIDFSQDLKKEQNIIFSAITLHPNFHLVDQTGSNVIYSAHIEPYDTSKKSGRLTEEVIKGQHTHDAVIIEWQLSNINNNQVNISHKREVLRIATTSSNIITQLSFNPYLKPWSDDFGLLYIALKNNNEFKSSPLYSGSILRINPKRFGLRNYTIPHANPFTKDPNIQDEVIILGAQDINQFTWSKQTKDQLIITHKYNGEHLISISSLGSDYLLMPPKSNLYKNNNEKIYLSNIYYKGRELDTLWNTILLLSPKQQEWQLSSIKINNHSVDSQEPQVILNFNQTTFPVSSHLSLFSAHKNELFVFDKTHSKIYKILTNTIAKNSVTDKKVITNEQQPSNKLFYFILFIVLMIASALLMKNKYNQLFVKTKSMLRSNFARFEFNTTTHEIALFKRHESEVNKTIPIQDINSSEIILNDTVINQVKNSDELGFNEKIENILRINFEQEHRDKMVDDKIRKVTLKLTTTNAEEFLIFSYLREGNQRLTKEKYHTVIEQVIDWQWYVSSKINTKYTPNRVIQTKSPVTTKTVIAPSKAIKTTTQNLTNDIPHKTTIKNASTKGSTGKVDTQLIDALNKLVLLKEQGYLNEDEFNLAKANLLEGLTNDV